MWIVILRKIFSKLVIRKLIKLIMKKKGDKVFGFIIKILGKRGTKEALQAQLYNALDTNKDGELSLDDFAKGKWKDISWIKLVIALALIGGSLYFGMFGFLDLF